MTYREPLLNPETLDLNPDLARVLTTAQWWKLAVWSLETDKPVKALLEEFKPIAEEVDPTTVRLVGTLPTCGLCGCLDPDGSVHT